MIPNSATSNIVSSPVVGTKFNLQADTYLFDLLTSKVYSNPIAAAIREISTNAVDASIEAGIHPEIEVHIPTPQEPFFSVRDYGRGMSPETINNLYSTIGASSKRSSNEYNGCMGIGKLAPLSYTNSFQLDSYYEGTCYSYLVTIQEGIPTLLHLNSVTTTAPSGVCVTFQVKPTDIETFKYNAERIYKWFEVKPKLNIPLNIELHEYSQLTDNIYCIDENDAYIVMGNVKYRIPTNKALENCWYNIVFKVPIGSVSINPGRETLSMDANTIKYINNLFASFDNNVVTYIRNAIQKELNIVKRYEKLQYYIKQWRHRLAGKLNLLSSEVETIFYPTVIQHHNNKINDEGYLNLPETIKVKYKYEGKKRLCTLENNKTPHINQFFTMPIYINDTTASTNSIIPYITRGIIINATKNIKLPDFISFITNFLDELEVKYTLYSSIIKVEPKIKVKKEKKIKIIEDVGAIRETEIKGNYILHGCRISSLQTTLDKNGKYFYIPISRNTFIDDFDKVEAMYNAYSLLTLYSNSIPFLVGINKSNLKLVKDNPNFIEFSTVVQDLLDNHVFIHLPTKELSNINHIVRRVPSDINLPDDLKAVITIDKKITGIKYKDIERYIKTITKYYHLKYITIVSPITKEDAIKKYPLLFNDHYNVFLKKDIEHYLKLEQLYDPTCLTFRQHTYTNTADPNDNNYTLPPELLEDT